MPAKLTLVVSILSFLSAFALSNTALFANETPSEEELTALKYYVQSGDSTAQLLEEKRLKEKYPDWSWNDPQNEKGTNSLKASIDAIYDLLSAGNVTQARKKIVETKTSFPGWKPTPNLETQLLLVQAQSDLNIALRDTDTGTAKKILKENRSLSSCDRVDNLWRLADVYKLQKNSTSAKAIYFEISEKCSPYEMLVSNVEKAEEILTDDELKGMIAKLTIRFPADKTNFEKLYTRLVAGRGVKPAIEKKPKPAVKTTTDAPVRKTATRPAKPSNLFPKHFHDLRVKGDSRQRSILNSIEEQNWGSCLARSLKPSSMETALLRGWCAYNQNRPMEAISLFSAVSQSKVSKKSRQEAKFGLVLALLKLDLIEDAANVAAYSDLSNSNRKNVELIILQKRSVQEFNNKNWEMAIAYFGELERLGGLNRDLDILRARSYRNLGQFSKSRREFKRIKNEITTSSDPN